MPRYVSVRDTAVAVALLTLVTACATTPAPEENGAPFAKEEMTAAEYVAAGNQAYAAGDREGALVQYLLALESGVLAAIMTFVLPYPLVIPDPTTLEIR